MTYRRKSGIIFSLTTLIYSLDGDTGFPRNLDSMAYYPAVRPILKKLYSEGYYLFLVLNIAEIIDGTLSIDHVYNILTDLHTYYLPADVKFNQIYYESDPKSRRYMPNTGMLKDLRSEFQMNYADLLMIGRNMLEYQCAKSAPIDFCGADVFFNTLVPKRI